MKKILIIEDRAEIRSLLRMTLDSSEYSIREAVDGASGLLEIERDLPDLVLLDIMMPGNLDGVEVCRLIKSDETIPQVKVVLCSARGHRHDMAIGRAAGADDYLIKPFSPSRLIEVVEHLLTVTT